MKTPDWNVFQYRVDFAPEEDRTFQRKRLVREATKDILAGYLFDGTVLYTPNRLHPDPLELFAENNEVKYRLTIRIVGETTKSDAQRLQVFNILMRRCLGHLKLQLVGRNYFDPAAKVKEKCHNIGNFQTLLFTGSCT